MEEMRIIEVVSVDVGPAGHACVASAPANFRYVPASAPLSATVGLPMDTGLFTRLMADADELGVLGMSFLGGPHGLEFLCRMGGMLRVVRAAVSFRLRVRDFTKRVQDELSAINDACGRPPFVILDVDDAPTVVGLVAQALAARSLPFCIVHRVAALDELSKLTQLATGILSAGAAFVMFLLDPQVIADDRSSALAAIADKLEMLRKVQSSHRPMQVQVRALHTPLPRSFIPPEPTLGLLFSQYLGGCSAGLLAGPIPSVVRPTGIGMPSADQAATAGPELPPNCCQAGMTHLAVDSGGTVYPCEEAFGISDLAMGDLTTASLAEIWAGGQWEFFRGGWDIYELSGCHGCDLYIGCACRRCRVYAQKSLGNRLAPMPVCVRCAAELRLHHSKLASLLGEERHASATSTATAQGEGG
jgi:radical SAM protein with 4Fe4S-binding SPASM domain